jgi:hypothetical protein
VSDESQMRISKVAFSGGAVPTLEGEFGRSDRA